MTSRPQSPALTPAIEALVEKAVEQYRSLVNADEEGCEHQPNEEFLCWRCENEINGKVMRSLAQAVAEAAAREERQKLADKLYDFAKALGGKHPMESR